MMLRPLYQLLQTLWLADSAARRLLYLSRWRLVMEALRLAVSLAIRAAFAVYKCTVTLGDVDSLSVGCDKADKAVTKLSCTLSDNTVGQCAGLVSDIPGVVELTTEAFDCV